MERSAELETTSLCGLLGKRSFKYFVLLAFMEIDFLPEVKSDALTAELCSDNGLTTVELFTDQ